VYKDKEKRKAWRDKVMQKAKLAYAALMLFYPFTLEDLPGEKWKWVKGYKKHYQISNFGRLKSFAYKSTRILRPHVGRGGYLRFTLNKKGKPKHFFVHVLVAKMFIPNPKNLPEVNHKFGVKFDNYFENLEWTTTSENQKHAVKMGLRAYAKPYNVKLTDEQVRYIRENYIPRDSKYGALAMSMQFNVSDACIRNVIHGITYKNVE